jgi:hypothetical protein
LIGCIRRNTNKGFAVTLQSEHYDAVNAKYKLLEALGKPYAVAGIGCAGELRKWAERKRIDFRKILCIFEDGDPGQGELIARLRRDGFNAIPQSKASIRAFDSADLAAWKARTVVDDGLVKQLQLGDPVAAARIMKTFDQLDPVLQINGTLRVAALTNICTQLGVPKR